MNDLAVWRRVSLGPRGTLKRKSFLRRWAVALIGLTLLVLLCLWLWPVLTRADDPSFTSREYFGTGLDKTWSVALGDLDGDGDLDIITGNGGDEGEQNRVYLNDGQGNFDKLGNAQSFGTGADNTQSVAVGDVDGDGDLDIAVGNDNYQQSAVYLNNGFGSFNWTGSARPFGGGDLTYSVGLGDVDGDGHLDVVTGNAGQNVVYLNDGSGSFFSDTVDCDIPTVNVRCFGTGEDSTRSVALADVDGDAYLDIVTGNGGDEGEQNRVYLNDGQGNFDLSRNSRFGTGVDSTRAVAVGDMDGDGDLDIVTGNYNQQNVVYLNDGTGSFPSDGGHPFGPVGDSTWSIGVGDLDSDGDLDVVTGNQGEQNVVYINDGQGNFPSGSARRFGTGQDITRSAVSGDVDGDGDLDIVTGNSGQQNVVYLNDGAGDYPSAGVPTFGTGQDSTRSVAVGDMDGDGYLDIVVGNYNQQNVVYVNDASGHYYTGAVECNEASEAIRCFGSGADSTRSVAVGDLNGDGNLDIVTGNRDLEDQNEIYLNDGQGHFIWPGSARIFGAVGDVTFSLALGDVDRDGDLDIITGSGGKPNVVFLNDGMGQFYAGPVDCDAPAKNVRCFGTRTDLTYSVALGDVDGDGHLDIVTGNGGESFGQNVVYLNNGRGGFDWPGSARNVGTDLNGTRSVALGDVDGDGDVDVITGNESQQNVVYLNDGAGNFDWLGNTRSFGVGGDSTTSLVAEDMDGDGDLDIVTGNYNQQNAVYLNDGTSRFDSSGARSFGTGGDGTNGVAVGDVDRDGDVDIVTGNDGQNVVHPSRLARTVLHANNPPSVAITRPGTTHNADFLSSPEILSDRFIPISYTLSDPEGDPVGSIAAYYSLDGGGHWYPATGTDDTAWTNLTTSIDTTPTLTNTHVFTWDTFLSGVFGQSDNVVFRLEAYPQPTHSHVINSYRYTNTVPGPYQRPYAATTTFPFRVRGTQVRVLREPVSITVRESRPIANAMVYRLPNGRSSGATLMGDNAGNPYRTDQLGYLQGRGTIAISDTLVAVLSITGTESYTLYHTSARPTPSGLDAFTVKQAGVQTLTLSSDQPLMLFNLDVSLEWDARTDERFMSRLQFDLQRASETLYDWTNGQAALGQVTIYHDREKWLEAHIRVYATNRMRPSAAQGGIVSEIVTDPVTSTLTYLPGQVHIGAIWNRYGEPDGKLSEDWPRTLAHELGHYAFFLDDNYLGLDAYGLLKPVDTCPGAMGDPYRDDDEAGYDEFHHGDNWEQDCGSTLAARTTGRWDWQTITTFYPSLNGVITNTGPSGLPLAVTQIEIVEPITPTTALEVPVFYLTQDGGRVEPGTSARAFLFQNDRLIDLGRSTLDQVHARGARPGDRVCLYELAAERLGCETVKPGDEQLTLYNVPDWQPEVSITPITSRTIAISVTNVPKGLSLGARLFSVDDETPRIISLAATPMEAPQFDGYTGTFHLDEPALEGYVEVWVDEEQEPRREVVTDFTLGGNPGRLRGRLGRLRGRLGRLRGRLSPSISADGQVILFGQHLDFQEGEFYTLHAATTIPDPLPWATVVGQAYRLATSANAPDLSGTSISFNYLGVEVPPGEEKWLKVYYWNGSVWQPLPTRLDTYYNIASAPTQGEGLYALMSSIEIFLAGPGWVNFGYPIQETRPITEALLSISGYYTTVYEYDATDPVDPWKIYDVTVPDWVNDLHSLQFGHSYWILVSQPVTLYLKGASNSTYLDEAEQMSELAIIAVPPVPATYYGPLEASAAFTPTAEMTVTGWIDGNRCGQSRTLAVDDEIVYTINVLADDPFGAAGCGALGRTVSFQIESDYVAPFAAWDNSRVQLLALHPFTHYAFVPLSMPIDAQPAP